MAGSKAVKEVKEGDSALYRCKVGNTAEVDNFLYRT